MAAQRPSQSLRVGYGRQPRARANAKPSPPGSCSVARAMPARLDRSGESPTSQLSSAPAQVKDEIREQAPPFVNVLPGEQQKVFLENARM